MLRVVPTRRTGLPSAATTTALTHAPLLFLPDQIREVMSLQGSFSIERMSQLAQVSRAGF